jgi:hypothetical protein
MTTKKEQKERVKKEKTQWKTNTKKKPQTTPPMTHLLYSIQGHRAVGLRKCKSIVIIVFRGQLCLAVDLLLLEHFFYG